MISCGRLLPRLRDQRAGYFRDPAASLAVNVPPGLSGVITSFAPSALWTGEPPRLHFRAPLVLVEALHLAGFARFVFRNPESSELPVPLAAAVDWPVWPRTAAERPLLQRSA